MTDRDLMRQALEALKLIDEAMPVPVAKLTIKNLTERLAHCDRCGKKLGGEGDIHTCTPKTNQCGETCERAKMCATCAGVLAQPEQEPIGEVRNSRAYFYSGMYTDKTDAPEGSNLFTAPPQPNDFHPDWDAMAVMVEEQQRMAKRIEELEAQPEQEPVANIRIWHKNGEQHAELWNWDKGIETLPDGYYDLYTAPPQRKPLTDAEVVEVLGNLRESIAGNVFLAFARAIEAAHGIKEGS